MSTWNMDSVNKRYGTNMLFSPRRTTLHGKSISLADGSSESIAKIIPDIKYIVGLAIFGNTLHILWSYILLLLVRCFRLRWDSNNNDSSLLHILGSSHDEWKQFAALIPRLTNKNSINERDTNSSVFSVQVKSLLFYNQILTEWTKAFRRYLQRRVKAMGLEKSFTSGVPFTRKSRRRRILSWAGLSS